MALGAPLPDAGHVRHERPHGLGRCRDDASGRRAAAARSRRRIVATATELFVARGYAGTTVRAVAEGAGVAPETVYATFGSKSALLGAALDRAVGGDDAPVPLRERAWVREAAQAPDLRTRLALLAEHGTALLERTAALTAVARTAAATEPDVASLTARNDHARERDLGLLLDLLVEVSALRPDVDPDEARAWFATLAGEATYLDLVRRGWTRERIGVWLTHTIRTSLLDES